MKTPEIGIMCATFNEEENVERLVASIEDAFSEYEGEFQLNILFIDNASTDETPKKLEAIALKNPKVRCIFNERNYGANRSSFHGMLQCPGDAVVMMCADFQDPPELLPILAKKWLEGSRVVMCRKQKTSERWPLKFLRFSYYKILAASHPMYREIVGCTGFGIYDRSIIDRLNRVDDTYPFFRGLVAEVCSPIEHLDYERPNRLAGTSSMNIYRLWDEGVVGLMNNSKLSIRLISLMGLCCALGALIASAIAMVLKLLFWQLFPIGIIPMVLLQLFSVGCIMLSLGVLGEYIGGIYTQSIGRDRVYEKRRLNF